MKPLDVALREARTIAAETPDREGRLTFRFTTSNRDASSMDELIREYETMLPHLRAVKRRGDGESEYLVEMKGQAVQLRDFLEEAVIVCVDGLYSGR